jgi:hypothetical protein
MLLWGCNEKVHTLISGLPAKGSVDLLYCCQIVGLATKVSKIHYPNQLQALQLFKISNSISNEKITMTTPFAAKSTAYWEEMIYKNKIVIEDLQAACVVHVCYPITSRELLKVKNTCSLYTSNYTSAQMDCP